MCCGGFGAYHFGLSLSLNGLKHLEETHPNPASPNCPKMLFCLSAYVVAHAFRARPDFVHIPTPGVEQCGVIRINCGSKISYSSCLGLYRRDPQCHGQRRLGSVRGRGCAGSFSYALVRSEHPAGWRALDHIAIAPGQVFFTLASISLREKLIARCDSLLIECLDILEGPVTTLKRFLGKAETHKVGRQQSEVSTLPQPHRSFEFHHTA